MNLALLCGILCEMASGFNEMPEKRAPLETVKCNGKKEKEDENEKEMVYGF